VECGEWRASSGHDESTKVGDNGAHALDSSAATTIEAERPSSIVTADGAINARDQGVSAAYRMIGRRPASQRTLVRADLGECDLAGALRRRDPIDTLAPSHQYL
jgi:hypothetical protein